MRQGWPQLGRHRQLGDAALAVALGAFGEVELFSGATYDHAPVLPGPTAVNAVLIVGFSVVLIWRRSRPLLACLVELGLLSAASLILGGAEAGTVFVLFIVVVYSGAAYARRPVLVAAAAAVTVLIHDLRDPHIHGPGDIAFVLGLVTVAWLIGRAVAARQHQIGRLEDHAGELERRHAAQVEAATAAERAAIARELHDIVAHAVSVVVIQAQAGSRALPERPEVAAEVLRTVESTGRSALDELRRLLTVLSGDVLAGDGGDAPAAPAPSLAQLDTLLAGLRSAGLTVTMSRDLALPEPPAATQLAVYRVVQEALTNTLRHAPGASARVALHRRGGVLDVLVEDAGPTAPGKGVRAGTGRGLIGMQQRLALVGGTLEHGRQAGGGYRVHAVVPVPDCRQLTGQPVTGQPTVALTGSGTPA